MKCEKCKHEIAVPEGTRLLKCPHCGIKYKYIGKTADMLILKNGQMIRKERKIRMSKKERRKLQEVKG